jgi:hypothetical protein
VTAPCGCSPDDDCQHDGGPHYKNAYARWVAEEAGNRSGRNEGNLVNGYTPEELRNGEHLDDKEIKDTFAVLNGEITMEEYLEDA